MCDMNTNGRTSRIENTILLFDIDGTLAESSKPIQPEMYDLIINEVRPAVHVGIVSGSDLGKILNQIGDEKVLHDMDYIFCENGVVTYKNGTLIESQSIQEQVGEEVLQKFINFSLDYMSKLELPAKRGTFLEFRNGTINICPIGKSCSDEERHWFIEFEKLHRTREKFVQVLRKEFSDSGLSFAIGGQTSFDVFPTSWDKTYCLKYLTEYDVVHFFGDKVLPGGNDHEIYEHKDVIGHHVKDPADTMKQVRQLLRNLVS